MYRKKLYILYTCIHNILREYMYIYIYIYIFSYLGKMLYFPYWAVKH